MHMCFVLIVVCDPFFIMVSEEMSGSNLIVVPLTVDAVARTRNWLKMKRKRNWKYTKRSCTTMFYDVSN